MPKFTKSTNRGAAQRAGTISNLHIRLNESFTAHIKDIRNTSATCCIERRQASIYGIGAHSSVLHGAMRRALAVLLTCSATISAEHLPFYEPYQEKISLSYNGFALDLFRRDGNCGSGVSCATMGDTASCCGPESRCAVDMAGHVACCPENAECTGTIAAGAVIASATQIGSSRTNSAATATITGSGGSIVPNGFFPFPYLPTTYPNAAVCSSSFSSCQTEFQRCTSQLVAGNNGLTISGIGPGITREAALPLTSATSICSSLSVAACVRTFLSLCLSSSGLLTWIPYSTIYNSPIARCMERPLAEVHLRLLEEPCQRGALDYTGLVWVLGWLLGLLGN